MPSCELCGRGMKGRGRNVVIEGASMLVCPECASKFGHASDESSQQSSLHQKRRTSWTESPSRQISSRSRKPAPVSKPKPTPRKSTGVLLDDLELIEDYAKVIRTARQKRNMSQDELAQRIGESISTLKSVEAGRQKPTAKTIRGLERELEISLLEPLGTVPIKVSKTRSGTSGPTLGDRVVVKKKMSQKARREDSE